MLAQIKKSVLIILLIVLAGYFLYRFIQYRFVRNLTPEGTVVAGIDVSGITLEDAAKQIQEAYARPVYLYYRDEHVELLPEHVGFSLDLEGMMQVLRQRLEEQEEWLRFAYFTVGWTPETITIPVMASHDQDALQAMLLSIGDFLDKPATLSMALEGGGAENGGEAGYEMDVAASMEPAEEALYRANNRNAELVITELEVPERSMDLLKDAIEIKLQSFNGLGSVFIIDLQTGQELAINADHAMSGLSIMKIAIFVEAYRALDDAPTTEQQALFLDTATRSSNYGANLLLHIVAGENNTYKGADILTESMRNLGLENTYMAVPYDATPPAYRRTTYSTPANSVLDSSYEIDETMQSTAEEIGTLLEMIYDCSKGGGTLMAVYEGAVTRDECQAIIDLMRLNEEGNLIRFGVPEGTVVSHKHGWAQATHADAGIVFTPGGNFVLVEYLTQQGDWLVAEESFPILREIARLTYNYFNPNDPYLIKEAGILGNFDADDPFSESESENAGDALEEQGIGAGPVESGDENNDGQADSGGA